MRPRPDAAENLRREHRSAPARLASMRPRPDAAENSSLDGRSLVRLPRFNEAAARCRGKPEDELDDAITSEASMRPRPDAAENSRRQAGRRVTAMELQ